MQNNVTELTQRLLRALDSNYNVIDMPAVIEIVSLLEKVTITKELLETTRLGKHVNELRRKTDNDSLSKRAKELVKKWRNMVLPDSNGQLKVAPVAPSAAAAPVGATGPAAVQETDAVRLKKRLAKEQLDGGGGAGPPPPKRPKVNGQIMNEFDFSDNSNSSFKDVISANKMKRDVILINSDSNSSLPETAAGTAVPGKQEPPPALDQPQPKKRGRKKGSKNHKNLLDEAETSFSNKLAVSRGNSKVKTTQELIAGLQNKNNSVLTGVPVPKPKEDLSLRAAKLTERVSIIDQKLNTNANRYKNSQRRALQKITVGEKNDRVIESGSVINDKSLIPDQDVIVVDDAEPPTGTTPDDKIRVETDETDEEQRLSGAAATPEPKMVALSVEDALAQLPPIDRSVLELEDLEDASAPRCTCTLKENKDFAIDDSEVLLPRFEIIPDPDCPARSYYDSRYRDGKISPEELHAKHIENVNGNYRIGGVSRGPQVTDLGLYVNVVPNVNNESIPKDVKADFSGENYKRYSISECDGGAGGGDDCEEKVVRTGDRTTDGGSAVGGDRMFSEWHEVVETPSYNGEIIRILPYVIID